MARPRFGEENGKSDRRRPRRELAPSHSERSVIREGSGVGRTGTNASAGFIDQRASHSSPTIERLFDQSSPSPQAAFPKGGAYS